jgi:hypothetical protein
MHFRHVRSSHAGAMLDIISHGWHASVIGNIQRRQISSTIISAADHAVRIVDNNGRIALQHWHQNVLYSFFQSSPS